MVLQRSTEINVLTNKLTGILLLSLDLSHKDKEILLSHTARYDSPAVIETAVSSTPWSAGCFAWSDHGIQCCAGEFVQIFCLIIYAFSSIQSGRYDCGLFAIAYTTSMAFGVVPCQIKVA